MRGKTILGVLLGFLAAAGIADAGGGPAPAAKPLRSYQIQCTVLKVAPDGKEKCLAAPTLMNLEGHPACFCTGGQAAVQQADTRGTVAFVPFGLSFRAQVHGLDDSRVRLDATVEWTGLEKKGADGICVQGQTLRALATVRLGEVVKLDQKADDGKVHHRIQLVITEPQRAATSPVEQKLDEILHRLEQVEKRLKDAENKTPQPAAQSGSTSIQPCLGPTPSALPVGVDLGFPVREQVGDQQQTFHFWAGGYFH